MNFNWDAYGEALLDYHYNRYVPPLLLNTSYGVKEDMPADVFFRTPDDFNDLELFALNLVNGNTLDAGAGAGAFSLALQQMGIDVTALEISEQACEVMKKRGVNKVLNQSLESFNSGKFDSILFMMNGLGLFGTLDGLREGLRHVKTLLKPGGQIIADSSDIRYLYESALPDDFYFGEINYQYIYHRRPGEWFKWIYVDQETLSEVAREAGLYCQVVFEGDKDHYLVIMREQELL